MRKKWARRLFSSNQQSLSFKMSVGYGVLFIWIIMVHVDFPFSTACLQDERTSLLDFKGGLKLSSGRLSSWIGFNCCEWEGVACDYHTSHVIGLRLSADLSYMEELTGEVHLKKSLFSGEIHLKKSQFSGEIRPSLFNLHHLQHLDLSWNDFKGISIPPQLSKLQKLTFLSLSNAGFGGEVPLELGNMSSLRHLDISIGYPYAYMLDGSMFGVWVRNLRSLEFLGMNSVNLRMASELWSEALSGLSNLTHIHLSNCGLSGNIPDLSNLTHLSHLHISWNSFPVELPSWFQNMSSLVSLDLSHCGLNGSIPSNFIPHSRMSNLVFDANYELKGNMSSILSHSSSLTVLSFRGCSLGGVISPSIANFSKLRILDLSHNDLEGTIPSSFGNILPLRGLYLSYNRLSGHIPSSLCQLPVLSELLLGSNQLWGTIPDSISKLASLKVLSLPSSGLRGNISLQLFDNLTRLRELDLCANKFTINISPSWVPQFAQLRYLGLRSCNIGGGFPAFLSQQYQLEGLDLSGDNIVGNIPSSLWDLPNLSMLNLSNNQQEGSLPRQISHNFTVVDLHGNRLNGPLPALDFVSGILDLSNNEFNGSIPPTIRTPSFLSLLVLDLSKNKLTGPIPANIGRFSKLLVLNLAQNFLQREIPQELGNLQALRTLNLNGNRLQGTIPSSIANWTNLQVLGLGSNRFEGRIPVWLAKLTNLRILSLASNKFRDRIPPQLFRLQNLQILDLSGNQLSGSIPPNVKKLYAMVNKSQIFDVQLTNCGNLYFGLDTIFELKFVDEVTVYIKGRATPYQKIIKADKFIDLSRNNLSENNLSGKIPSELLYLTVVLPHKMEIQLLFLDR
ncbi:hypothetical protein SUGI_0624960 [Cryptomeria japonica]|nr:hypothetical protein SUGI_0624960 [Cryptomeria japonica]